MKLMRNYDLRLQLLSKFIFSVTYYIIIKYNIFYTIE